MPNIGIFSNNFFSGESKRTSTILCSLSRRQYLLSFRPASQRTARVKV